MNAFHLSLPCLSIGTTTDFYSKILGAEIGRSASNWVDVNLYSHQITFCKTGPFSFDFKNYKFDGTILPTFHFGVILDKTEWNKLYKIAQDSNSIVIKDTNFLLDKPGEHKSFFVKDPNGYVLEFKNFKIDSDRFEN